MKVLYVSQYFPPEIGAPAARVHSLSREWVKQGHDVTVLTAFAHHPTGVKARADRWCITRREKSDGIKVVRSYVYATANSGTVRRMASFASFMAAATAIGSVRVSRPDVVIATSPQLLCGCAGWMLAKRFGCPFVFEVRDLWPESIMAVGAMKENFVVRSLKRVARQLYQRSQCIVTVGEGYRQDIIDRYDVPLAKIHSIPNGIDTHLFRPGNRLNQIRARFGWGKRFVAAYVGTHGMAHGLQHVLQAAKTLKDHPDILFVFIGEGAEKATLKRMASDLHLDNVQFIDPQPRESLTDFYAACDVGLVCLKDQKLFQRVLPSKIFEYLGSARPVLISVRGEARNVIEDAGAGVFVEPENADALARSILDMARNPAGIRAMGESGHRFVNRFFDRNVLALKFLNDVLEPLAVAPNELPPVKPTLYEQYRSDAAKRAA